MPNGAATAHLLRPKLVSMIGQGYGLGALRADAAAGLTVAIVALPLSMAIAVASGVSPERGLFASIVGGFVVSALGGSRFQIGGPAGAFIVLVAAASAQLGLEGLLLAIALSGLFLSLIGLLRLGALIRHIPHPVTVGFTCAIAAVIIASQLKDFLGMRLAAPEPGPVGPKLLALGQAASTVNLSALCLSGGVLALIVLVKHLRPAWPGMLMALAGAAAVAILLHLPVETIGGRFGALPRTLPAPHLPSVTFASLAAALPSALSFTLLGAVESLLSAKVADGMTGRRHRANMELIAQGLANMASAVFGGLCVTGAIARTATNIRAGARSPLAGMFHSLFLLAFLLVAAPLARYIPLAALAAVLVAVAWNMAERREVLRLLRDWRSALVLLSTFSLTLARDLTAGILAGCLAAAALALLGRRVAEEGDAA